LDHYIEKLEQAFKLEFDTWCGTTKFQDEQTKKGFKSRRALYKELSYTLCGTTKFQDEQTKKGFKFRRANLRVGTINMSVMVKSFSETLKTKMYFQNELATSKLITLNEEAMRSRHFVELVGYVHENNPYVDLIITKLYDGETLYELCRKVKDFNGWTFINNVLRKPLWASVIDPIPTEIKDLVDIAKQISQGLIFFWKILQGWNGTMKLS
jgi:hypothetical protein